MARPSLLVALSGHLVRGRAEIGELLSLDDDDLIAAIGGARRGQLQRRLAQFDARAARRAARRAGLELICRCDPAYPARLREAAGGPMALHVVGGLDRFLAGAATETVAIVGSRAASPYGTSVARSLARRLAASGLPVISGMALGIDSAAHLGALGVSPGDSAYPATIAVLPGSADRPYPKSNRRLYRQLVAAGNVVSELPPGAPIANWTFPARNRIIAALAAVTVVVEASERSGALLTARFAEQLGRLVGAVPGRVTAPQAVGSNALLKDGAVLVRGAQDVLDLMFEAGTRAAPPDDRPTLRPKLAALLHAIGNGHDTPGALHRKGLLGENGLAQLAELELTGYVRRGAGGRYALVP